MDGQRPGLEIEQDEAFQRREWSVQRVGWGVLAVVLGLAALGLFGNGPLSHATADEGDLTVGYQRFARNQGHHTLMVQVAPGHARDGRVTVLVSQELLGDVRLDSVSPEPSSTVVTRDHVAFSFDVADDVPLAATFHVMGDDVGVTSGEVALTDGTRVRFRQLVYP